MTATLEILKTGPLALVEDLGRPGLAHMGVSRSGAADRRSHTLANRLVANPNDRATIEVTFGGFSARVHGGGKEGVAVAVTGADAELRCDVAGITLNKNAIPFDPQKPNIASGIRVGTPSVTTQGMGLAEMDVIADVIHRAVTETDGTPEHPVAQEIREQVTDLVTRFPAYPR